MWNMSFKYVKGLEEEHNIASLFFVEDTDHKSKNEDEMEVNYLLKWV